MDDRPKRNAPMTGSRSPRRNAEPADMPMNGAYGRSVGKHGHADNKTSARYRCSGRPFQSAPMRRSQGEKHFAELGEQDPKMLKLRAVLSTVEAGHCSAKGIHTAFSVTRYINIPCLPVCLPPSSEGTHRSRAFNLPYIGDSDVGHM